MKNQDLAPASMTLMNRRTFLTTAAGLAAASGVQRGKSLHAAPDELRPRFHSRHIPIEWLNLETPMGRDVVRNGLCDTIKPDVLKRLRDFGVELIEMRVVWWEIEPAPGRFFWDRTLRDMDAVQNAGLKVGLMAWLHYPPDWYDPTGEAHARLRALGSKVDSTALSLWDPKTVETYDRLLGIIDGKLKARLSFVYNTISGNYGEVVYSLGAKHYKFTSRNTGPGFWAGDRCARASFAKELQRKYETIAALNKAWGTQASSFDDDLMPRSPFPENSLRQRDDYMQWCTNSVLGFADRVCELYQKHFPGLPGGLPIGFTAESIAVGQIKSRAAKLAAKYGLTARWTGSAHLGSFDRSHLPARRLASAAHFYGAPFGTEAALIINAENAANALYESLANGSSMIHDDPQNILRAAEVHAALRPKLVIDPPVTPVAVFYPVESEMLQIAGFSWTSFVDRCAEFRHVTDYDVCDSTMITDGYLAKKRDLFFLTNTHLPQETARAVVEFAARAGRVWLRDKAEVTVLYQSDTLTGLAVKRGVAIRGLKSVGTTGLYRFTDMRLTASHIVQGVFAIHDDGEACYRTMHRHHESCYFPKRQRFEIRRQAADDDNS
ncbi:MAG: hypothetical protein A2107_10900 [Verrucomicrobia bacterium GWF2_62_7]|nr:MAG: hypothetical protein A2107_10900 [Verrucomicrobia bacterium GWF2_62_7]